jgi:hypothetical protein
MIVVVEAAAGAEMVAAMQHAQSQPLALCQGLGAQARLFNAK